LVYKCTKGNFFIKYTHHYSYAKFRTFFYRHPVYPSHTSLYLGPTL